MKESGYYTNRVFGVATAFANVALIIVAWYQWRISSYGHLVTWQQQHIIEALRQVELMNWLLATACIPIALFALLILGGWLTHSAQLFRKETWAACTFVAYLIVSALALWPWFGEIAGPPSSAVIPFSADPRVALSFEALVLIAFAAVVLFGGAMLMPSPETPGFCAACNYDLRATPRRCPECGLQVKPPIKPA